MLRISTARRVADTFWPEFVERDGVILLPQVHPPEPPPGRHHRTVTEYERFHGHTHFQDLFRWDVPMRHDPEWDLDVPDSDSPQHAAAWQLTQRIARMWLAKLMLDFPAYRFRVYASRLVDPIIHFHRVREGEPMWIRDEEAVEQQARGDIVVLDSGARPPHVAAR